MNEERPTERRLASRRREVLSVSSVECHTAVGTVIAVAAAVGTVAVLAAAVGTVAVAAAVQCR